MAPPSLVLDENYRDELAKAIAKIYNALPNADINDMFSPTENDTRHFIFEVYVYFELARGLLQNAWSIRAENVINGKFLLPRSPGKKANFSYLSIKNTDVHWHLVHGTAIVSSIPNKSISPDISLQATLSGHNPQACHVMAIWDAKFHEKKSRITDQEYRGFVWV